MRFLVSLNSNLVDFLLILNFFSFARVFNFLADRSKVVLLTVQIFIQVHVDSDKIEIIVDKMWNFVESLASWSPTEFVMPWGVCVNACVFFGEWDAVTEKPFLIYFILSVIVHIFPFPTPELFCHNHSHAKNPHKGAFITSLVTFS